jgi:hypothetical protein
MPTSSNPLREYMTDDVYGISRDLPLNYVDRDGVDSLLIDNLSRRKHIVIYGSSKQGKTSVRKRCLKDDDYISVQCNNQWELKDLLSNILKRAGYRITLSEKKTVSGINKIVAEVGLNAYLLKSKVGGDKSVEQTQEEECAELEIDPSDVNDIIAALFRIDFKKYIVLEDFHYLPVRTQKNFSVALKAFHEASGFCFIIIGVWLEENRLVVYNGDLTGRLVAINADCWSESELQEVIESGERLLNIAFDPTFKIALIKESYGSVSIVQEACRSACILAKVRKTEQVNRSITDPLDTRAIVKSVVNQQTARYKSFLLQFAAGFQDTRLEMYKWLLYPILAASPEKLEDGFKYADLRRAMQAHHPLGASLNLGNLTQALQSTASLQVGKDITPIILDYDQTNSTLNVVDRGFVIWLQFQDKAALLDEIGLPAPNAAQTSLPLV